MQEKKTGKKYRNLLGTALLVGSLLATQIPVSDVEATSSSPSDFRMNGSTLVEYTGTATTVSVPDTVKIIGSGAFSGDEDLYTVYLPEKLEKIESDAFAGCKLLSVVDLPDTLTEIGDFAFSGCATLSDVELGEKVRKIGDGAFAGCDSLETIAFDKDNESFVSYGGALYDKQKTVLKQVFAGSEYSKYTMPDSVKEIRSYAFWGCDQVRFAALSSYITEIPAYGMSNCGLEEIVLPYSLKTINTKAFADCVKLQEAEIPPTVTYIHPSAFDGCPLLSITAEPGSAAKKFDDSREKTDAAEYEDTEGQANTGSQYPVASGQTDGTQDNSVASQVDGQQGAGGQSTDGGQGGYPANGSQNNRTLGQAAVVGGQAFVFIDNAGGNVRGKPAPLQGGLSSGAADTGAGSTGLQFPDNQVQTAEPETGRTEGESVSGAGLSLPAPQDVLSAQDTQNTAAEAGNGKKTGFPKYTIAGDKIAAQAYYKDQELTGYTIPEQITRIGDFAFARSGLTSVTIPEGVEEIGYGAFYHCDDLEQVILPSTVTSIEPSAFEHTGWLENWQKSGNVNDYLIVGEGILLAYKGKDSRLTLPEGIRQIGAGVFQDHKGITAVSLPNTLEVIGEDAFAGCTNLTDVSGGVAVREIRDRAFAECPLNTIRIPQSVTEVGLRAYDRGESTPDTALAVVFMGNTLPAVGYEKTATRLSNAGERDLAFRNVTVAIISDAISEYQGTVLDAGACGFRGLICSVEREASGSQEGLLKVKASSLEGKAAPESVTVYGSTYRFQDAPEGVQDLLEESGEKTSSGSAGTAAGGPGSAAAVKVLANSSVLPDTSGISALLQSGSGSYHLVLRDSSEAGQTILNAYRALYGTESEPVLYGFEINLYDTSTNVPITKLGSSSVKVKMPLPQGMTANNLHIVCTDEDGQLEETEFQAYTLDGIPYVEWTAKHFSPYGIYQYESGQAVVSNTNGVLTALARQKDVSPNTGDWLHPKWFLALGLFAAALAVFLSGRKKSIEMSGT